MKNKVIVLIKKVINLLIQCGYNKNAKWFENNLDIFINNDIDSEEFQKSLMAIKSVLGGMGSFSDLSMLPVRGSNLSEDEAREMQWDLSEDLYNEIVKLIKK